MKAILVLIASIASTTAAILIFGPSVWRSASL
ncbi:hypothetical protein NYA22BAC_00934 [Parasphingorhabdus sp. NYA22]